MKNNRCGQSTVLSPKDFEKILLATPGDNHKMIFRIAYFTAARMGEVCKLSTKDVFRLDGETLPIITYQRARTKTRQSRQVPVSPILGEFLKAYWLNTKPNIEDWLFPGDSKYLQFQSADDALRRAIDKAGLAGRGISSHSFRRTAATNLHNAGAGLAVIREITGHATLTSLQRYIQTTSQQVEKAIALL